MSARQRVRILNQGTQSLLQNMGVDLGCRDVGMPQKKLHTAQICAPGEQVRGEGVPQHVR